MREAKQKYAELSRMNESYIKNLHAAERERDDLKAKLDAELMAAWREDLASLNECLERVERERDELKARLAHAEADAEQAVHGLQLALRNVLMLSKRIRKTDPENAEHLVRFCREAGIEDLILRGEP